MCLHPRHFLEFEGFRYDLDNQILRRGSQEVGLSPLAMKVFDYLIRNRERPVSKTDLKAKFWKDAEDVDDNRVDKQIRIIRKSLGPRADGESFIETKYKVGLQFVAEVEEVTELPLAPVDPIAARAVTAAGPRMRFSILAACAGILVSVLLTSQVLRRNDARVLKFTQLTNDGRIKSGPLLVNDERVFFVENPGPSSQISAIPLEGGDPTALPGLGPGLFIQDISQDGKALLLQKFAQTPSNLYMYSLGDAKLRELNTAPLKAIFGPEHHAITIRDRNGLRVIHERNPAEIILFEQPQTIMWLNWSPDGSHLRFWVADGAGEPQGISDFDSRSKRVRQLPNFPKWTTNGAWSRDGAFFFFDSGDYVRQNISVVVERGIHLGPSKAIQLTQGPGSWNWPAVGKDASRVFALSKEERPELVRFDDTTKTWIREWDGFPAMELDYSRDRQWVAFVHLPDHSVWKARPDGTEKTQLTFAGIVANQPHWSPDGSEIAFMAQNGQGAWRVFLVPSAGGAARELSPDGDNQGVPTWSVDGKRIVFGERLGKHSLAEMCIQLLDVKTGKVQVMDGSKSLWSPRWSPNGRYILALTTDNKAIRLWDVQTSSWHEVIRLWTIDNAAWSFDSGYVHFDARLSPGEPLDLFRVSVKTGKLEKLADMKGFTAPVDNWYGVSPDGALLASKAYQSTEIYELKCRLPE